jgi:putative flippase GtrA
MKKLVIKYAIFAALATVVNLGTQKIVGSIYSGALSYWVALFGGTMTGLIVKYFLDKKYIFYYIVKTKSEDAKKFMVYSVMGIATTAIFWGFQTAFFLLFPNWSDAKYLGAAIGLSIGYFVKYQLDKRFVFSKSEIKEI